VELITSFFGVLLHLDQHLQTLAAHYGGWIYAILFLIIFCETGLVVTPFLPGDSLLFVSGTVAAAGVLDVHVLAILLLLAAVLGDSLNYAIGRYLGPKVFHFEGSRFFNPEHLRRAHAFYERHGGKTIVLARFIPIIRTYAPFVAGVGAMTYRRFIAWNVGGAVLWVGLVLYAGYFFGNIPLVRQNLSWVIIGIIVVSIMPGVVAYLRERARTSKG
jgi:membrane-associated protein